MIESIRQVMKQNFYSFLLLFDNDINSIEALNHLPNLNNAKINIVDKEQFILYYYNSDHPLSEKLFMSNEKFCLIIFGEFYDDTNILLSNNLQSIINQIDKLNGNYNAIIFDKKKKKVYLRTDYWGFHHLHYNFNSNGVLCVSSSLWPLIFLNKSYKLNYQYIRDKIAFGRGLDDQTIINDINIVQPETIVEISLINKSRVSKLLLNSLHKREQDPHQFLMIAKRQFDFVQKKCGNKFGLTFTAGKDSRVILNSMLNNNIKPALLNGFVKTPNEHDSMVCKKAAIKLNLQHNIISYNKNYFSSLDLLSIFLSNGGTRGTFSLLLNILSKNNDFNYWGFSGDKLSEKIHFNSSDEVFNQSFLKCYRYSMESEIFDKLFNLSNVKNDFKESFTSIENMNKTEDLYFYNQKMNRNFQRIHDFSVGSKISTPSIYFYHDKNIINYYNSLKISELYNQKHHTKLSYLNNSLLRSLPLNNYPRADFATFLKKYLSKYVLFSKKIIKRNKYKDFSSLNDFHSLLKIEMTYYNYLYLINDIINIDSIYKLVKEKKINNSDYNNLINAIDSLLKLLAFINNKTSKNYQLDLPTFVGSKNN
jgi:hypothetical protein